MLPREGGAAITSVDQLDADGIDELWPRYLGAFEHLRTKAAARMVMHRHEFETQMKDQRILKYVVRCGEVVAGAGTLALELDALDWVSPDFYAARFPEQYAAGRVYGLGWLFVHPDHQHRGLRLRLLERMAAKVIDDGAMIVYDTCRANETEIDFTGTVNRRLTDIGIGTIGPPIDEQLYYAWLPFSKAS